MKLANVTAQPTRNLNPESLRGRTFFFRQTSLQLMSPHALQGRGGICMSGFWRDASLWASSLSGQDSEEETDRELIWGFIRRHPQLDVRTVTAAAGPNDSHRGGKKKKKHLPRICHLTAGSSWASSSAAALYVFPRYGCVCVWTAVYSWHNGGGWLNDCLHTHQRCLSAHLQSSAPSAHTGTAAGMWEVCGLCVQGGEKTVLNPIVAADGVSSRDRLNLHNIRAPQTWGRNIWIDLPKNPENLHTRVAARYLAHISTHRPRKKMLQNRRRGRGGAKRKDRWQETNQSRKSQELRNKCDTNLPHSQNKTQNNTK